MKAVFKLDWPFEVGAASASIGLAVAGTQRADVALEERGGPAACSGDIMEVNICACFAVHGGAERVERRRVGRGRQGAARPPRRCLPPARLPRATAGGGLLRAKQERSGADGKQAAASPRGSWRMAGGASREGGVAAGGLVGLHTARARRGKVMSGV